MRVFILSCLFGFVTLLAAQPAPRREGKKWGMRENEKSFLAPVYDTVFAFDSTGRVCLACSHFTGVTQSGSMKITSNSFACNYFNKKKEKLRIKVPGNDTCSVFGLSKNSVSLFQNNDDYFVVSVKAHKYLVGKNFRQMTFRPYTAIYPTGEPAFYVTENKEDDYEGNFTGLITVQEKTVVTHKYSSVKVNPRDSLILACSAGMPKTEDIIYDYNGKQLRSSHRHIQSANRNFMVEEVFEPEKFFVICNMQNGVEKNLDADEVNLSSSYEALIRIKKDWYTLDMRTMQKKPFKKTNNGQN